MEVSATNEYKSKLFKDETFLFVFAKAGSIELLSKTPQQTVRFRKTSDHVEDYSATMDKLLTEKKSSPHFYCHYSIVDSLSVDSVLYHLEKGYHRILADLKVDKIATITVKVYPDFKSFHRSINLPQAPDDLKATAFGKEEIRMVSPTKGGEELMKFISHEFTHCVHLNMDYSPNNPRWLWEGLAMYESSWFMDPKELPEIKSRNFPKLQDLANGYEYILGYVIIEAIKDTWGFEKVIELVKNRGNTEKVVGLPLDQFEVKVFDQIYKKYVSQ
jgi:hypothetical protein